MSIATEIARLQQAKSDLKDAIEGKGVTVPANALLDDYATLVGSISSGGGTTNLKQFVLRPDAEKIQTYTYDKQLVKDEEIALPAYTTTSTTLKATWNLSPTITLDFANYNYVASERMMATPIYKAGTSIATGRVEYWFEFINYDLVAIEANTLVALSNTAKKLTSRTSSVFQGGAFYREVYWSSTSALTTYTTNAYGPFMTATAPSTSGTTWTIKAPDLKIRGHSTYLRSAVWSTMEDIRYQFIIDIYRAPKGNLNIDGWGDYNGTLHIADCISNGGTLT